MDSYSQFIAKSRYARYIESANKRETWKETVQRYMDFMVGHLESNVGHIVDPVTKNKVQRAIENLEVVPSMRAIMTSGKALARDNVAGYNCSYLPIDDPKAFDEAAYILSRRLLLWYLILRKGGLKVIDNYLHYYGLAKYQNTTLEKYVLLAHH